jgi:DNA mismatch repair protein MutS
MMAQYMEIKRQHEDALLMFRLGDFYELFLEDAEVASRILDITLTGREAGEQGRIPMCGVPYHSAEQYIDRLIEHGLSVAICEQTEDPKSAKGLVKREVVRIVTPGTSLREDGTSNRYLASLVRHRDVVGGAFVDVATGEVHADETTSIADARDWLLQWRPAEVLLYTEAETDPYWKPIRDWQVDSNVRLTYRKAGRDADANALHVVRSHYGVADLTPLDLARHPVGAEALGLCLSYIRDTQKIDLAHLREPQPIVRDTALKIDHTALSNLEVLETVRTRQRKGSLYGLLDQTRTALGSRLLRKWLERPLTDPAAINRRLDAVCTLASDLFVRSHLQETLDAVYDLERLTGRVAFCTANARDLVAIARSLETIPELVSVLSGRPESALRELVADTPDLTSLAQRLGSTIVEDPPVSVHVGGMIRAGVDETLDELKALSGSGKSWLASLEQQERERTGIKSLKVGYNKVFGYFLEVSKSNIQLVPPEYERRQTLANAERYVLPVLKEREAAILNAEEQAQARENELFTACQQAVLAYLPDIQKAAADISAIDVLCSLAQVTAERNYVRPIVSATRGIHIEAGRHPVVEAHSQGSFVPNDVRLGDAQSLILITGPNMAGKSTYMRQTALIVLMAHIGCPVPAASAQIGAVDRIFTRIGASDDLGAGKSTFMVEMVELAQILRLASTKSLVLLDEIGRGTSTYDGLCIAEAVVEALQADQGGPLTLFATHYHELTQTVENLPAASNYSVLVEEDEDDIAFLHTVVARPADKSYGVQVAKLAGVPQPVIDRALALLAHREGTTLPVVRETASTVRTSRQDEAGPQADGFLFSMPHQRLTEELANTNVMNLTPLEAMNVLNRLVEEAKEVMAWDKSR